MSNTAVEEACGRSLKAHACKVEDFTPTAPYDVVTGFDVIEHVLAPASFVANVRRLLRPDGVLALTTPDTGSLTCRLMGPRWYFYIPMVHNFHFNRANLARLLTDHGFELLELSRAGKALTYDYSLIQFKASNPLIYRVWWLAGLPLPRFVRRHVFRIPIGEMMVIARRRA